MAIKKTLLAVLTLLFLVSCHKTPQAPVPDFCRTFITLGPTITELTLALGAGERLLGVSRYDDLPEVAEKPRVGGILDPEIERIAAISPSCLFYIPSGPALEMRLKPLKNSGAIKVVAIDVPSLKAIPEALEKLGKLLHTEEEATKLRADLMAGETALSKTVSQKNQRPRAVIVYGLKPLVVAGAGSLGAELMTLGGFDNPIKKDGYPVVDEEYLATLKLDIVFDMSHHEGGEQLSRLLNSATKLIILNDEELRHPSLKSIATWQKRLEELGL